jgi:hypothetical protein
VSRLEHRLQARKVRGTLGFRDLAYASATTGYLIHFNGGPVIAYGKGLMKTASAGASWRTVPIP